MKHTASQGDILKVSGIGFPVLVVSKNFFNEGGMAVVCPILDGPADGPLHVSIHTEQIAGVVHCESLKLIDLQVRRFSAVDRIAMRDIIEISDIIQGIFDYI